MNELNRCKCGGKAAMRYLPEMGVYLIECHGCKDCLGADTKQRAIELWNEKNSAQKGREGAAEQLAELHREICGEKAQTVEACDKNCTKLTPISDNEEHVEVKRHRAAALIMTGILFLIGAFGNGNYYGKFCGTSLIAAGIFILVRNGRAKTWKK